ncbi:MAG: choice-of-anchor D domain-containing protein [Bacteroidetes bacterium]|nr:MAG: choice-of-anchor D domain-containing protein [Bacteroidota bacterium]
MKRITLLLLTYFVFMISSTSLFSQPNTGNFTMQYTDRGITSNIYFWVPENYDSTKSYPFLLAWHGSGDTGENNRNFFAYLLAQRVNAILVCPDVNNILDIMQQDVTYFTNLTDASYNYTLSTYNIDTNKIVVMGFSMGGSFAYQLGLLNPDMFNGIIGLAPAIGSLDQTMWSNIKKLRMSTILGDKDNNYTVVNKLMNDIKNAGGALLYLVKPGVKHVDNDYFNSQEIIVDLRQCYDYVVQTVNSPTIILNRSEIDFDTTGIGNQKIITLEITNIGTANLIISEININNDQDSVFQINGTLSNITITPGSKHSIDVVFNPKDETDYTGHISISSNDSTNLTLILNISGTGYSLKPIIECSDEILNYGNVKINETKNQGFRIYNTGNQNLNINDITLENIPNEVITLPSLEYPLTIKPLEYYTFTIGFSPKDTIIYQGRIKISSNASNSPDLYLNITGKGIAPTGVEDFSNGDNFSINIEPNPVESYSIIKINYNGVMGTVLKLELVNIEGNIIKEIYNNKIDNGVFKIEFKLQDVNDGVYFILAKIEDKVILKPLIKMR